MNSHLIARLFLFTSLMLAKTTYSQTETQAKGIVSGIVSYFYNEYQGDKADIGAKVYVVPKDSISISDQMTINKFFDAKANRSILRSTVEMGNSYTFLARNYRYRKKDRPKYEEYLKNAQDSYADTTKWIERLKKQDAETEEKFSLLDRQTSLIISKIKFNNAVIERTVDGAGNYRLELPAGAYIVAIQSKGRKDYTATEAFGKIFVKPVSITKGETVEVSAIFGLH